VRFTFPGFYGYCLIKRQCNIKCLTLKNGACLYIMYIIMYVYHHARISGEYNKKNREAFWRYYDDDIVKFDEILSFSQVG